MRTDCRTSVRTQGKECRALPARQNVRNDRNLITMKLIHGGDWAGFETEYGKTPLDFSANISPLGLPERVRAAALRAVEMADRYPDPLNRRLCAALADYHSVPASNIVCGSGASDLIYRLCHTLRPKSAAVFVPGFAEYARALRETWCHVTEIPLSADFCLTQEQLTQIPQDCELLFLCNPNNPTGLLSGRELLLQLLDLCRERGTVVAMDECFLDFCEDAADCSLVSALAQYPELIIIKAFTKTCAMAGLRLGYVFCGSTELAEKLRDCGQPWAVSVIAEEAGIEALCEEDYVNQLRTLISAERRKMKTALEAVGMRVVPGEANFLLFRCTDYGLAEKLRERGILIRDCANFAGLEKGW